MKHGTLVKVGANLVLEVDADGDGARIAIFRLEFEEIADAPQIAALVAAIAPRVATLNKPTTGETSSSHDVEGADPTGVDSPSGRAR